MTRNIIIAAVLVARVLCTPVQAQEPDIDAWIDAWQARAAQGDANAAYKLAETYAEGVDVPQDTAEAVRWSHLAAEQGHVAAQYQLGTMYADGEFVAEDDAEAAHWFRLAAEQGHADAQYNLGAMYLNGEGVVKDNAEALSWFRLAAEQGDADAQAFVDEGQRVETELALAVDRRDGTAQALSGAPPAEIRNRLGLPREVIKADGRVHWRYISPDFGEFDVVFRGGRVSRIDGIEILDFVSNFTLRESSGSVRRVRGWNTNAASEWLGTSRLLTPSTENVPPSELYGKARVALTEGRYLDTLLMARECIDVDEKQQRFCQRLYDETLGTYIDEILGFINSAPSEDLYLRKALLSRVFDFDSERSGIVDALTKVDLELSTLLTSVDYFAESLHVPQEFMPAQLVTPGELYPYRDYVPEIAAAELEATTHTAIGDAYTHLSLGHFDDAAVLLEVPLIRYHFGADVMIASLRERVTSFLAETEPTAQNLSLGDIEAILGRLRRSATLVGELQPVRDAIETFRGIVVDRVRKALDVSDHLDAARIKVSDELLLGDSPELRDLVHATSDWKLLATLQVDPAEASCGPGIWEGPPGRHDASALHETIKLSLPDGIEITNGQASIHVRLTDVRCDFDTVVSHSEPLASTYVASTQQNSNPEYVQRQQELQYAEIEYERALIDNPVTGNAFQRAAIGALHGVLAADVAQKRGQLASTPPYISVPVQLAYQAERFGVTQQATVTANVILADATTGFSDGEYMTVSTENVAVGVRNALESDSQGLRNVDPNLLSEQSLIVGIRDDFYKSIVDGIHKLGERAFLDRAAVAHQQDSDIVSAFGNLFLADAFQASPSEISGGLVNEVRSANINELGRFASRLEEVIIEPSSLDSPTRPGGASRGGLAGVLKGVLPAVVTIETETGNGSGFFISRDGLLLTNAHVIEGSDRVVVRTERDETFLARIVSVPANDDLALLKVSGNVDAFLPLGDSSEIGVGIDLVAVGSPLGLEGTVTRGILSAIRKMGETTMLQTDAAISPGNSGGPLLTEDGQVVGINTLRYGDGGESLGFAISVNDARRLFSGFLP